jgi:hypothetical protein
MVPTGAPTPPFLWGGYSVLCAPRLFVESSVLFGIDYWTLLLNLICNESQTGRFWTCFQHNRFSPMQPYTYDAESAPTSLLVNAPSFPAPPRASVVFPVPRSSLHRLLNVAPLHQSPSIPLHRHRCATPATALSTEEALRDAATSFPSPAPSPRSRFPRRR